MPHQRFHFIAIGGAVMHQLAIYLHQQGNIVSGSDDVIFDPAKSNLEQNGILPKAVGWHAEKITKELDGIILGMHAKPDNPELKKAQALGIKIYSFPSYIYHHAKDKKRLVVAGSHGKTTITSMIMHILNNLKKPFDYLVGSQIKGFETMVKVSDAPLIIIEGDEYLSSPIDSRSKFLHYKPHIAIISGIAWDHINVFPVFEDYLKTFSDFINSIADNGKLFYYKNDKYLPALLENATCETQSYTAIEASYSVEHTIVEYQSQEYKLQFFGQHNMENLNAALLACEAVGVSKEESLKQLESFEGSAKRLELLYKNIDQQVFIYRDFAHAPSKLIATLKALRNKYKSLSIVAIFELHTYSSLQPNFLPHYKDSLKPADISVLFLDDEALKIKRKENIEDGVLQSAFNQKDLSILRNKAALRKYLSKYEKEKTVFAFMSSGNFNGFDINSWQKNIQQKLKLD